MIPTGIVKLRKIQGIRINEDYIHFMRKINEMYIRKIGYKAHSKSEKGIILNRKFDFIFYDYGDIETRIY